MLTFPTLRSYQAAVALNPALEAVDVATALRALWLQRAQLLQMMRRSHGGLAISSRRTRVGLLRIGLVQPGYLLPCYRSWGSEAQRASRRRHERLRVNAVARRVQESGAVIAGVAVNVAASHGSSCPCTWDMCCIPRTESPRCSPGGRSAAPSDSRTVGNSGQPMLAVCLSARHRSSLGAPADLATRCRSA